MLNRRQALASTLAAMTGARAVAQDDAKILTVSGRIGRTNSADKKQYVFSFGELTALGNTTITSTTRFAGHATFVGPTVRDVLKAVQAAGDAAFVAVVAIDGYQQRIPIPEFAKYDVVLAHTMNGKRLTVETKGPLWVMYPNDKHKELVGNATLSKLVWSLTGLVVA
jgi:hypothetical protein